MRDKISTALHAFPTRNVEIKPILEFSLVLGKIVSFLGLPDHCRPSHGLRCGHVRYISVGYALKKSMSENSCSFTFPQWSWRLRGLSRSAITTTAIPIAATSLRLWGSLANLSGDLAAKLA